MRLKGKTALIAGAGRNNGRAVALTFAREGADLILVAKQRANDLDQVVSECRRLGANVLPMLADVADAEECNRVVRAGLNQCKKIDVLVCVAGVRQHKPFWEFSDKEWLDVFNVNVHSTFYLSRAVVPGMMERRSGSIIAFGSISSLTAFSNASAPVASKHGLYGLIKSLAFELGPYGIRANLIAPAGIENHRLNPEWYAHAGSAVVEADRSPLNRKGTNQEVANVALFLASDESSYVTGDRIACTGGRYMG